MKMYMHSKKAIRGGSPSDRVFLVVDQAADDPRYLIAWKCTLVNGRLEHPAFGKHLSLYELPKGFIKGKARNGAMPTAVFKPDSFYREIKTLADMEVTA